MSVKVGQCMSDEQFSAKSSANQCKRGLNVTVLKTLTLSQDMKSCLILDLWTKCYVNLNNSNTSILV